MKCSIPADIYLRRSGVFIDNFEHFSHLVLVFLLLTLNMELPAGMVCIFAHKVPWIFYETVVKYIEKMTEHLNYKYLVKDTLKLSSFFYLHIFICFQVVFKNLKENTGEIIIILKERLYSAQYKSLDKVMPRHLRITPEHFSSEKQQNFGPKIAMI